MAGSLNVLRLASHFLIALVRIHDRPIHVREPLVVFVVHRSMVARATGRSSLLNHRVSNHVRRPVRILLRVGVQPGLDQVDTPASPCHRTFR
jgi:hypothetical protein